MKELKQELLYLKENHSLVGIKGGTEVEAMTFDEILEMKKISLGIVPMTVKIGGPEARNDIDFMLSIGVEKILAPMIESAYSLKNFVTTIKELDKNNKARLAINIETITAYKNMESIVRCPEFILIDQVTVGRTDLSSSMEKSVEDEEVNEITKEIVALSRYYNKKTSTGGKINPVNAVTIKENIKPDYINTRNMIISCKSNNISNDISAVLIWEKKFYEYLSHKFISRKYFYLNLINSIEKRVSEKVFDLAN